MEVWSTAPWVPNSYNSTRGIRLNSSNALGDLLMHKPKKMGNKWHVKDLIQSDELRVSSCLLIESLKLVIPQQRWFLLLTQKLSEAVHLKHPCWKLKEIENRRAAVKQGWTLWPLKLSTEASRKGEASADLRTSAFHVFSLRGCGGLDA